LSDPNDFARRVLAAAAKVSGEKVNPAAFIATPSQPPARHPTTAEMVAATRKSRPSLLIRDAR
jgi:hypothetical protein